MGRDVGYVGMRTWLGELNAMFGCDVQEKEPFMSKAVQKKSEYDKSVTAYKTKQVGVVEG